MTAGHKSFVCHAKEHIFQPKDNGKPLKGLSLGVTIPYDQILILERVF